MVGFEDGFCVDGLIDGFELGNAVEGWNWGSQLDCLMERVLLDSGKGFGSVEWLGLS